MTQRHFAPDQKNDLTIFSAIARHTDLRPDTPALLAPNRLDLNYAALQMEIVKIIQTLNGMGIGPNDRVAVVLPNGPEMAVVFLAAASCATCAPLNPAYRKEEYEFYLSDLGAKVVIVSSETDSHVKDVARTNGIKVLQLTFDTAKKAGSVAFNGNEHPHHGPLKLSRPEDVALVLHTSGTTSRPKLVPLSQFNLCQSAMNIGHALQLKQSDLCLNVMPLFHIHGLIGVTLSSIWAGASVACSPGFDDSTFFNWLSDFGPTWYSAVPTMHQAILANAPNHGRTIHQNRLRFIRSSSSALPPQVMKGLEETFQTPVIESYGMTEASHQMTSNPLPPAIRKPGSVGLSAGPQVAIMDEKGLVLPQNETGEIVVKGTNVTQGYENNPGANAEAFYQSWFRTGDLGYLDADGYLFIAGRLKEVINRGGEKVSPREVDEVLLGHQAVAQAVTFAIPHQTLGEDVAAAIVLCQNSEANEKEIREYAFASLADHKVPSRILFVDEIPKGPTGKLQRIGLAEKLASQLEIDYEAPQNMFEETLAGLWQQVLEQRRIGSNDNFFALGGDSLLATQIVSRVRAVFQVELPLPAIFQEPTLAGQALLIEEMILDEIEAMTDEEADAQLKR